MEAGTETRRQILDTVEMRLSPTLQRKWRKWNVAHCNLKAGDLVLLKDDQVSRNEWPMTLVTAAFPSADGKVRKVELKTTNQDTPRTFLRPLSQVILLLPGKDKSGG